jgi:hypothetical protein
MAVCRYFVPSTAESVLWPYAGIWADMRRFGHSREEVPKVAEAGLNPAQKGPDFLRPAPLVPAQPRRRCGLPGTVDRGGKLRTAAYAGAPAAYELPRDAHRSRHPAGEGNGDAVWATHVPRRPAELDPLGVRSSPRA